MSLRELLELREDARGLAEGLALARYRRFAGLPYENFRELLKQHRLASSADGLAQAREALAAAESPAKKARLGHLADFLAQAHALALEPGAAQELFDCWSRPLVHPPGDAGLHGGIPPVAALRELRFERSRDKRGEMHAALASALQPLDGARAACWDAALEIRGHHTKFDPAPLLDATDALAKDLGGWLLERHTGARGDLQQHDVLHFQWSPRFASAFVRGELVRSVRRWVEMLRLDLTGVKLDTDDRPLKSPGAFAEPLDPPYEAGVTLLEEEGPRALASALGALGAALQRTGPPESAPPEDLWLGDPAVTAACAALFEGLVREPEWLRRCAKVELPRDDERAVAVAALLDARIDAARALASAQARELGLSARAASLHRDLYARAALAELPLGLALEGLDPFAPAAPLEGRALAAAIRAFLRERYDEDWWRNPRSLASLDGLFARGGRPTAAELWSEIGATPGISALVDEFTLACR